MIDIELYEKAIDNATNDELQRIYEQLYEESEPIFDACHKGDDSLLPLRNEIVRLNEKMNKLYQADWEVGDRVSAIGLFPAGTILEIKESENRALVKLNDSKRVVGCYVIALKDAEEKMKVEQLSIFEVM